MSDLEHDAHERYESIDKEPEGVALHRSASDLAVMSGMVTTSRTTIQEIIEHATRFIDMQRRPAPDIWCGLMQEADAVAAAKGRDYTKGSDDRLANFKNSGADAGITPEQAWLVFYNKHHSAICSYIRSHGQSESEPIKGRIVDAINYLRLFWLLVLDTKETTSRMVKERAPGTL